MALPGPPPPSRLFLFLHIFLFFFFCLSCNIKCKTLEFYMYFSLYGKLSTLFISFTTGEREREGRRESKGESGKTK